MMTLKNYILPLFILFLSVFVFGQTIAAHSTTQSGAAKKVAVRVTFPGETNQLTIKVVDDAFKFAKDAGINIAQYYPEWGKVETRKGKYNWEELDNNISFSSKAGMKASLIVKIVDNFKLGHLPGDIKFTRFDDPVFIERFTGFILAVLDRFDGKIEYLYIGNEIDIYFEKNRDHIDPYIQLYSKVYAAAKAKHPDVRFGTISTYHDAYKNNALDIVEDIGKQGDILGFTLYPQNMGMQPADTIRLIQEMSSIAAKLDKKFTLTETGFSTQGMAGSEEKQAHFVEELYKGYEMTSNMDCLSLFILYDLSDSVNDMIAASYGVGGNKDFLQWLGTLGVLHNNGKPKKAWAAVRPAHQSSAAVVATKSSEASSAGNSTSQAQTTASNSTMNLSSLKGLGGTTAVDINKSEGSLVWEYKFSNVNNMSMIADFDTRFNPSSRSLSMSAISDVTTTVAIVLIEKGDVNYEKYVQLPAGKEQLINLTWSDFKLQQGKTDKNKQLDIDQVKSWTIIDLSGFSGKSGSNKITFRNVSVN